MIGNTSNEKTLPMKIISKEGFSFGGDFLRGLINYLKKYFPIFHKNVNK